MLMFMGCLALNAQHDRDAVVIQKVGNSYLFVFPTAQGRIVASMDRAGRIDIGKTITVKYALKITGGRARFILLDATNADGVKPTLSIERVDQLFGFLVKDTKQPKLDIHIDSSFMQKVPPNSRDKLKAIQDKVAREGNLDVMIGREGNVYKILNVRLN